MGILKNLVIATTGTHHHPTKQIERWIERNGGRYSATVHKGVTHLLASKEAYKHKEGNSAVQQAASLGIQILSYDWLDDSLQARRRLGTKSYLWETLRKQRRQSKKIKRLGAMADSKRFREGCVRIRELTGSGTCKNSSAATAAAAGTTARRKARKSRSFFFSSLLSSSSPSASCIPPTPFVSAKEDLLRRRAEREEKEEEEANALEGGIRG